MESEGPRIESKGLRVESEGLRIKSGVLKAPSEDLIPVSFHHEYDSSHTRL